MGQERTLVLILGSKDKGPTNHGVYWVKLSNKIHLGASEPAALVQHWPRITFLFHLVALMKLIVDVLTSR